MAVYITTTDHSDPHHVSLKGTSIIPPQRLHSSRIVQHINPERLIRESKVCVTPLHHSARHHPIYRTKSPLLTAT